jgi:hypothetical protein
MKIDNLFYWLLTFKIKKKRKNIELYPIEVIQTWQYYPSVKQWTFWPFVHNIIIGTRGVKRAKPKWNRNVTFHILFERNVAKYFIFVKITLKCKKFRLRSIFLCSNVTKKSLYFDVETSKRRNFDTPDRNHSCTWYFKLT